MDLKEFRDIAKDSARNSAPENYSINQVNQAFADGLNQLIGGSINNFLRNRYDFYDIIIENADEIVPNKVIDRLSILADVVVVPQGQKAVFKLKKGKDRAKRFLTQVGLSGVYETARLDVESVTINPIAVGGGVTIDYERMLDGTETLADVMEVLTDGLVDAAFGEVQKALRSALNSTERPDANKVTDSSFDADSMFALMGVARSYGTGVVIFAPPEFIGAMGADAIVPVSGSIPGVYHPQDIDAIHNSGYINIFRGAPIVQIPQSYTDETNTKTQVDPQLAYIFPTGREKVVKLAYEGQTQIYDRQNTDNSIEIYAYRKLGCAILTHYNWCIYQNTGITQTYAE